MSEMSSVRKSGLSFDEFVAYKSRCMDPKSELDPDHYFHNFDLEAHNANAKQVIKIAEQKRIEAES